MWLIGWLPNSRIQYLKLMTQRLRRGKTILKEWKKLTLSQGALHHHHTPTGKLEDVLQIVVSMAHWVAAMNGCHQDAGHQGQQQTLCRLHDQFWWPGMATQMQKVINNCKWCIQHEGICAKALMQPIIVTAPLELLHVDLPAWIHQHGVGSTPKTWWTFCSFATTFWNTLWWIWPLTKLWKLLLSFCGEDTSWSLEHWPSSWVTKGPTLKATSSESFASLWAYRRLGLQLIILKPMDRWNELTKCWYAWYGN